MTTELGRRLRVLFVGNSGYHLPLSPSLARKWDALCERLHVRVIARAERVEDEDERFRLLRVPALAPAGTFHAQLPFVLAHELRSFHPEVVLAQSPYEALAVLAVRRATRSGAAVVVEVHGDWRAAARGYGSRTRGLIAPAADTLAVAALRRADGTRALSPFSVNLALAATGRKPLAVFPTYSDLASFVQRSPQRLPEDPCVAWVGALQPYKNPAVFAAAWRIVARRLQNARAVIVGDGPLRRVIAALADEFPATIRWHRHLTPPQVASVLDEATLLALPSRSEGLPRVAIESFARGRPVVGSRAGGIPDIVRPGHNGLLVPVNKAEPLADALLAILSDRALAERLAAGAAADAPQFQWSANEYADEVAALVARAAHLRG